MARLGLKNYQTPSFNIPTQAPDQRTLNQLSKFGQWLHSVYDWKTNGDKDGDADKEPSSADDESGTDISPASTSDRSFSESENQSDKDSYDLGYDPAGVNAEEAFLAGKDAEARASEDYKDSMEEAFENAMKARGEKFHSMSNAAGVGASGDPTLEVQDFVGFTGKDRDGKGGPATYKALYDKVYEDGGAGADKLTAVEPEYGWATETFDPATISLAPADVDGGLEDLDNTGNQQYQRTPRGGYRGH